MFEIWVLHPFNNVFSSLHSVVISLTWNTRFILFHLSFYLFPIWLAPVESSSVNSEAAKRILFENFVKVLHSAIAKLFSVSNCSRNASTSSPDASDNKSISDEYASFTSSCIFSIPFYCCTHNGYNTIRIYMNVVCHCFPS